MRTQSMDTSEAIERVMIQGHRRFSSIQRFSRVRSLTGSIYAMRSSDMYSRADALRQHYGIIFTGDTAATEAPPFDIQPTLLTVTHLAESLGATVVLTGGVACCLYGFPRTVRDVDLIMTPTTATTLYQQLAASWLPLPPTPTQWSLIDPSTLVKVDLMTAQGQIPIDPLIARRQPMPITDESEGITVLSAEDVLLTRLAWYQDQGTSPDDQWNDLMGVVKIHAPLLDRPALRAQARVFHLERILDQLLDECDEGECVHGESHGYPDGHCAPDSRAGSL
jgi:hypothetical protein